MFLPLIGCLAYLFTEIVQRRHVSSLRNNVTVIVNPGGKIRDLEKKFNFSDTFATRVALADAYLAKGMYKRSIAL